MHFPKCVHVLLNKLISVTMNEPYIPTLNGRHITVGDTLTQLRKWNEFNLNNLEL